MQTELHKKRVMCSFHFETDYSFSDFTIQPMSASVLLGETAKFMCVGEAIHVFWRINGHSESSPASIERGVEVDNDNTPPVFKSNLTIPGTVVNDNVSIHCVLVLGAANIFSPDVYLTVLGKLCIVDK